MLQNIREQDVQAGDAMPYYAKVKNKINKILHIAHQ